MNLKSLITASILLPISIAHAQAAPTSAGFGPSAQAGASRCQFEHAIAQKGLGNYCLEQLAQGLTSPLDRQRASQILRAWQPPKDLNIVTHGIFFDLYRGNRLLTRAAWISFNQGVLYWNGRVVVQSHQVASLDEKFRDLFAQIDKRKVSALDILLPLANAQSVTSRLFDWWDGKDTIKASDETAARLSFFFYSAQSISSATQGRNSKDSKFALTASDMIADLAAKEKSGHALTVQCQGNQIKSIALDVRKDERLARYSPLIFTPQNGKYTSFTVDGRFPGQSLLVDYAVTSVRHILRRSGDSLANGYFAQGFLGMQSEFNSTLREQAWNEFFKARPDIKEKFARNPELSQLSTHKCNQLQAADQKSCEAFFDLYISEQSDVPALGISPASFSKCLDLYCSKSEPIHDFAALGNAIDRDTTKAQAEKLVSQGKIDVLAAQTKSADFTESYIGLLKSFNDKNGRRIFRDDELRDICDSISCRWPDDVEQRLVNADQIAQFHKTFNQANMAMAEYQALQFKVTSDATRPQENLAIAFDNAMSDSMSISVLTACQLNSACRSAASKAGLPVCSSEKASEHFQPNSAPGSAH